MSAVIHEQAEEERRMFPRMLANCPIRYMEVNDNIENIWGTAKMLDYSATGLRLVCDKVLFRNSKVTLYVIPGKNTRVPQLTAEGIVVRCGINSDHQYEVAFKFTKVKRI